MNLDSRRTRTALAVLAMPTLIVLSLIASACGQTPDTRRASDTVAAAPAPEQAAVQAGEVMSARHEAQSFVDAARAAFVARNMEGAASSLTAAATFTRRQADSIADPARTTLMASSAELARLSDRVARKEVTSVGILDQAFAKMQLAEAQFHCVRGLDAAAKANAGAASSELTMLVDHFERASADAGKQVSTTAKQATANARSVAARLATGEKVPAADVEAAFTSMDSEVHSVLVSVAKPKS